MTAPLSQEIKAEAIRLRKTLRLSESEICRRLKISAGAAHKILARHRLTPAEIAAIRADVARRARIVRAERHGTPDGAEWRQDELSTLERLYRSATWADLCTALPGRTRSAIHNKGGSLGLTRMRQGAPPTANYLDPVIRRLIAIRKAKGLTQVDLAKRMHGINGQICALERGRTEPLLSTLRMWVEALGADLSILQNPSSEHLKPWTGITPVSREQMMGRKAA